VLYNFCIQCSVGFYSKFWSFSLSNRGTLKQFRHQSATSRAPRAHRRRARAELSSSSGPPAPSPGHPVHRSTLRSLHATCQAAVRAGPTGRAPRRPSLRPLLFPPLRAPSEVAAVPWPESSSSFHHKTSEATYLNGRPPPRARPCRCRPAIATAAMELHLPLAVATALAHLHNYEHLP
jgi:hypothetical protein